MDEYFRGHSKGLLAALAPPDEIEERIARYRLDQTCDACPEQYDVYDHVTGECVGYMRLRHGIFRVHRGGASGQEIFEAHPEGDGVFEYEERSRYLRAGALALDLAMRG